MEVATAPPVVLFLHSAATARDWPAPSLDEVTSRRVIFEDGAGLDSRVDEAAQAIMDFGKPMHVLASGDEGAVAIRLAVAHPDLVKSLVLADCDPDTALGDVIADLPRVEAPTLVLCASPEGEGGFEASQTLAGQISNGVLVVLDDVERPAHTSRPGSFSAWSNSFISIIEGLRALS